MMSHYKLLALTPLLETPEVETTIEFYRDILGFHTDEYSKEYGWAHLSRDEVRVMISRPNDHRNIPAPVFSGSLYIRTDNVNSIWDDLKEKCKVAYPIENFDYGMREFGILDNNDYLIQFGEEIKP